MITPPTITVNCLGTFKLTINGRPIERWQAGKSRNLLQFLLTRQGRVVSREDLYAALWPDLTWSSRSSSLKVAAHMLRRILATQDDDQDAAAADGDRSSLRLVTHPTGYAIEARRVWMDFEIFDQLITRARLARQVADHAHALELFRRAVDLYRGHYLPDVTLDWAEMQREWLRSRVLYAMQQLTEADLVAGDHLTVIDQCRKMLEIEPYREETYRILILMHGQLGHLAQVRRWHRLCVARLRDELQISPSEATERLYTHAVRGRLVKN